MADEPNTRMDETLKAYAGKRRQEVGAPFDLHPATRQMLQGEVARTYKHTPQAGWLRRVILYWPRLAFATACVAITITLMLVVLPRKQVMEMAKASPQAAAEPMSRDARLSDKEEAEKAVEAVGLADRPVRADNRVPAPSAPLALPPPSSSIAPVQPQPSRSLDRLAKQVEADESKAKSDLMAEQRKDTDAFKLTREEIARTEDARRAMYANKPDTGRARYTQQNNAPAPQLGGRLQKEQQQQAQVLNTFEFEQVGDTVRVIDGDGSVYVGNMLSETDVKKRGYVADTGVVAGAGGVSGRATEAQQMFYAIGTNITLRQKVSIEANILQLPTNFVAISGTATPAQVPAKNERTAGQEAGAYLRQNVQPNAAQNAIRGRARVGTNQEVPIDAISIKP